MSCITPLTHLGGEYEAIETLQLYCKEIEEVYSPGCIINIVSDGHVFSDCQGTDDDVVTEYNHRLKAMTDVVAHRIPLAAGGIRFHDLKQLLLPDDAKFLLKDLKLPKVNHPVETKINPIDDKARALMMAMYALPPTFFSELIKSHPQHPITLLYCGFSRFMYQDLEKHPTFRGSSKSQIKKVAENVALEMVQRNQAYSRIVECLLPCHVRLSIHGHNNAGPKFAVKLVPLRPCDSLEELVVTEEDAVDESRKHLHVPTPWHNCIVDIYHHKGALKRETMLCKSQLIVDALRSDSQWQGGYDRDHERGGRWILFRKSNHFKMAAPTFAKSPMLSIEPEHFRLGHELDFTGKLWSERRRITKSL